MKGRTESLVVHLVAVISLIFCLALPAPSQAEIWTWSGKITAIEQNSFNRAGEENLSFFRFIGGFSGGSCAAGNSYLNGSDNQPLLSIALSAMLTEKDVVIVVDDAKPNYFGVCQVIYIKMN